MKLNKSQISAIASKLEHEHRIKAEKELVLKSKKYMPDAVKVIALEKQRSQLDTKIDSIKKKYVQGYVYIGTMTNAEAYALEFAKKKETVNSKFTCGSIEEALTIASVDAADMDALMKNYEKFLI